MKKPKRVSRRKRMTIGDLFIDFTIGTFAILCLLPVWFVFIVSLTDKTAIQVSGYSFFPKKLSLESYEYMITFADQMAKAYLVTIYETVFGTALTIFLCSMMGYVLSRSCFRLRKFISIYLLITMLFNGGAVSSYLLFTGPYHLQNNLLVLILPGAVGASTCFFMKSFIKLNVHDSLIESAKMDGAGEFYIYHRIVMPLIIPGTAALSFTTAIGHWNQWATTYMYLNNGKYTTVQGILMKIEKSMNYLVKNMNNLSIEEILRMKELPVESTRMAILIVALGPILVAFPFFQKYFVKGMNIGAIKG